MPCGEKNSGWKAMWLLGGFHKNFPIPWNPDLIWSGGNSRTSLRQSSQSLKQASELEGTQPDACSEVPFSSTHRVGPCGSSRAANSWSWSSCSPDVTLAVLQVLYTKQGKHHSNHHWLCASRGSQPEFFSHCNVKTSKNASPQVIDHRSAEGRDFFSFLFFYSKSLLSLLEYPVAEEKHVFLQIWAQLVSAMDILLLIKDSLLTKNIQLLKQKWSFFSISGLQRNSEASMICHDPTPSASPRVKLAWRKKSKMEVFKMFLLFSEEGSMKTKICSISRTSADFQTGKI